MTLAGLFMVVRGNLSADVNESKVEQVRTRAVFGFNKTRSLVYFVFLVACFIGIWLEVAESIKKYPYNFLLFFVLPAIFIFFLINLTNKEVISSSRKRYEINTRQFFGVIMIVVGIIATTGLYLTSNCF